MELTDEQLEGAAIAALAKYAEVSAQVSKKTRVKVALKAAAPFLQLPWDEPDRDEACDLGMALYLPGDTASGLVQQALSQFVRRRNTALLPTPVDPRIAIIRHQLGGASMVHDLDGVAAKILHALDQAATK